MNIYSERLIKEWETHGKIIIGVDFDSTISPYHTIDNQSDIDRAIELILAAQSVGCYIMIHTACNADRHSDIIRYCTGIGIHVDGINETVIDLPYGKDGSKPYCNIYLDDRAGLVEALNILEDSIYTISGKRNTESTLNQIF